MIDVGHAVELVLSFNWVASLHNGCCHFDRPLNVLDQDLCCPLSDFFHDSAAFPQNHPHLYIVSHVNLEVDADFAVQLGHPGNHLDSRLVRNLLEVLLHHGLLEGFLGPFDRAFVANHALVVCPRAFLRLAE